MAVQAQRKHSRSQQSASGASPEGGGPRSFNPIATVKSIDPAAFMDQAAIDYVLAVRALHAGSVIMTHAVFARPASEGEWW